ncbi:hypothetical protein SKAU_G00173330 [Synaphobranchus kaupii]|uniref:SPRY-associated domain-containing protein n=1 Tax=Synaphobranchus kaupii TaxID=118154 RepID=A0A9Q1FL55_SYNKA|nr:hypothetical protein SKAU_G00173330 [Synaphobranchus kaupii]
MVTAGGLRGESKLHITEDFNPPMSAWKMLFFLMVFFICVSIPVLLRAWRKLKEWRSILKYAATVTLDPRTAYNRLVLSADGKEVYMVEKRAGAPGGCAEI